MLTSNDDQNHFANLPVPRLQELEKIGEGRYREVYKWEKYALKVLRSHITKQCGPITITIPTRMHLRFNCGIEDFNAHEFENYQTMMQKIPQEYRAAFNSIHTHGALEQQSASLSDIVYNADGSRAKSLFFTGTVEDPSFWKALRELHDMLFENKIFLMDVRAQNILVQDNKPILFDYKRLGATTYPMQPWLQMTNQKIRRMQRRLERLETAYRS